jgi:NitT/TauT family transport system ATP-binding protein
MTIQDFGHSKEIRLDGVGLTYAGAQSALQAVASVFQSPVLLPWLTIEQNVMLPAEVMGLDRRLARSRAAHLLDQVGLKGFERSYPYELSGGMQQRAGIARALLQDPDVLLMDEPFAALDALTREQMSFELQRIWLAQRKTVIFVTHGISEAVLLSSKILVMSARPSRVLAVLDNPLPRPRTLESMRDGKFVELTLTIRRLLEANSDALH